MVNFCLFPIAFPKKQSPAMFQLGTKCFLFQLFLLVVIFQTLSEFYDCFCTRHSLGEAWTNPDYCFCLSTSLFFPGYDVDWSEDQDLEIKCVNTFFASESLVNTFLNNVVSNDVTGDDATSEQYQSGRDESDESRALALGNAVVSSVSWNCQGSLFAASLANTQHEHWCIHKVSNVDVFFLFAAVHLQISAV